MKRLSKWLIVTGIVSLIIVLIVTISFLIVNGNVPENDPRNKMILNFVLFSVVQIMAGCAIILFNNRVEVYNEVKRFINN